MRLHLHILRLRARLRAALHARLRSPFGGVLRARLGALLEIAALSAALSPISSAPAFAQSAPPSDEAAILVADSVLITDDERLVATGNVEAFYNGTRLFTDEIIYDQGKDELIINSPVRISQDNGDILVADSADLDSKLENGILIGARYVLNQELQILSAQTDRVDGRYTVLRKVAATSCQICGKNGTPIWQIRADRAIHDTVEKQIYFRNAQFRLLGVPVLYLPRMRIPDPELDRATGFLVPRFVSGSSLGLGVKLPYFIKLGDHADLTIAPYLSNVTRTSELRFRRQFHRGYVELNGALSRDTLRPNQTRSYLTGYGVFDLGRDFVLSLDVETASDAGYRATYGYEGRDRLGSGIQLTRTKRDVFFQTELLNYETLRDTESNATQPTLIANLFYERRYSPAPIGGELRATLDLHGHARTSRADILGRDMNRVSFDLGWQREWTAMQGLRFGVKTGLGVNSYGVSDDSTAPRRSDDLVPTAAVTLRYPLQKRGIDGARYLIEPIAQIGWTGGSPSQLPNDESVSSEFDESNLLSLSRFPTKERRETGTVAALGLRWERQHAESWSAGLTLGQVVRSTNDPAFSTSSGLSTLTSATLMAAHFETLWGGAFTARSLFDAGGGLTPIKAEARMSFTNNKLTVGGNYIQLNADAGENRAVAVAEWSLTGTYRVNRHWTANAEWQYDMLTGRAARSGAGLTYENECIEVGLGATRTFAQSITLVPATTYELAVSLRGFSTGGSGKAARRICRN